MPAPASATTITLVQKILSSRQTVARLSGADLFTLALAAANTHVLAVREGVIVASLALARGARNAPVVQAVPWDLVIIDEAHHIKNRSTASFKLVDGLKSRFLLLLTATPIETEIEELYNLVTLLKPGQFATPAAFRAQFVDSKDPLSPKNRERLRGLLAEVMVRNTRADSGLSLPPRYVSTVAVEPLAEEQALYQQVVAFVRAHAGEPGARMLSSILPRWSPRPGPLGARRSPR